MRFSECALAESVLVAEECLIQVVEVMVESVEDSTEDPCLPLQESSDYRHRSVEQESTGL